MDGSVDVEDIEKVVDIEREEAEQRVKQEAEQRVKHEEEEAAAVADKQEDENGKLGNLISSFFHHGEEPPKEEITASAEKQDKQTDDSSLVDSLIARLPSPLSDEAAPETEEAFILIHYIVHD